VTSWSRTQIDTLRRAAEVRASSLSEFVAEYEETCALIRGLDALVASLPVRGPVAVTPVYGNGSHRAVAANGSNYRYRVINLLMETPERPYTVAEVAHLLGISTGQANAVLSTKYRHGTLRRVSRGVYCYVAPS